MSYEHDYYSDQCAGCKWAEWRGGCLNKATAEDGSDLDAADRGECKHFEAGNPQRRPPQPGDRVYVHIPLAEYDALRARAEVLAAELAQARADARTLACQWRAVDDTEDLQFFGACWYEAHPGRSEGDLGRDPTMTDLVAALRRALGGAQ